MLMENGNFRKVIKIIENSNIDYYDKEFILVFIENLLKENKDEDN